MSEAHHRSKPSIPIQAHKYNNAASKLAALRILDEIIWRPGIFPANAIARPREAVRRLPESSENLVGGTFGADATRFASASESGDEFVKTHAPGQARGVQAIRVVSSTEEIRAC